MTPPWLRLLDPSNRLTISINGHEGPLLAQNLIERRRPRRGAAAAPTQTAPVETPPAAVTTQANPPGTGPAAPVTTTAQASNPTLQAAQQGFRAFGLRLPPLLGVLENGGLLTQQYGVQLQTQYRAGNFNLLGGLGYSYHNLGETSSVGALSSRSEAVNLHEVGATFGLEDSFWDPRRSSAVYAGGDGYLGAGGPSSTWLRASVLTFTGGHPTQAHNPIFQFSLGNTSSLATGGFGNFEFRLGITNEVRFSSSGAAIEGLVDRNEGDLLSNNALGAVSIDAWYYPQGRMATLQAPNTLTDAELVRGLAADGVNLVTGAMRSALVMEASQGLALLANSTPMDRRTPSDVATISLLPRADIAIQSSIIGWSFAARGAEVARNWNRMTDTQQRITAIESGILGGAGLLSLLIFSPGDNFARGMSSGLITSQAYQWLGVLTRNTGDWRWLVHGGSAVLGLVGFFTSNALAGTSHPEGCEGGPFSRSVIGICDGALGGVRGFNSESSGFVRDIHRTADWNSAAMALLGGTFNFALGGERSSSASSANGSTATTRRNSAIRFTLNARPGQLMFGAGGEF